MEYLSMLSTIQEKNKPIPSSARRIAAMRIPASDANRVLIWLVGDDGKRFQFTLPLEAIVNQERLIEALAVVGVVVDELKQRSTIDQWEKRVFAWMEANA
jgi:hypothetical protein